MFDSPPSTHPPPLHGSPTYVHTHIHRSRQFAIMPIFTLSYRYARPSIILRFIFEDSAIFTTQHQHAHLNAIYHLLGSSRYLIKTRATTSARFVCIIILCRPHSKPLPSASCLVWPCPCCDRSTYLLSTLNFYASYHNSIRQTTRLCRR